MVKKTELLEIWLVTGSHHLYGPATLKPAAVHSTKIVEALGQKFPAKWVFKPVLKTPDKIRQLCLDANRSPTRAGLILWRHIFSPSKRWIGGL